MNVSTTGAARSRSAQRWPGDPSGLTAAGIDFEALAHVLANTCRWGGRTRRFYSVAQRAVVASEAIASLDGLKPEERRTLALRALLADARIAWLGDVEAGGSTSARAAERHRRDGAAIDRAVLEAAGLDGVPTPEQNDLLRFVARMTDAAERRDLDGAGFGRDAGVAFPPLKRRIRPVEPGKAARLWLKRFRELTAPPAGAGASPAGAQAPAGNATDHEEKNDGAHLARTQREETQHGTEPESQGRARAA
ncbi:MAG: hypothetical protein F4222_03710 [Gammaproteobacteria bacterium]|nr:hypothetical protein [Gammaproteobacteria bacterium]MXZ27948.1 hypothetical protein [Gammaproteobacteria bacterium]MYF58144.1 hypothetical protein [Gammaproteobacteria bacterium]